VTAEHLRLSAGPVLRRCASAPPAYSVDLWLADLRVSESVAARLMAWLSRDERRYAERLLRPSAAGEFRVTRGLLRGLLATHLGIPPERLAFGEGPSGKLHLEPEASEKDLRFNLSHSHTHALFALARSREVGVDLEHLRADFALASLIRRALTPAEQARLLRLPPSEQALAFLDCWTRKEAYLKARGVGLTQAPGGVEVGFGPTAPRCISRDRPKPGEPERWSLHEVKVGPGFVGALAIALGRNHASQSKPKLDGRVDAGCLPLDP
jgi:4'-phosphopantetheinyl transferase